MSTRIARLAAASTLLSLCGVATANFVAFDGNYFQDFNGLAAASLGGGSETLSGTGPHAIEGVLGSTGMAGWFGGNYAGSSSNTEFKAQNGSLSGSAGRGVVFFGTTGSTERALGALSTSNQVNWFGVVLMNDTTTTFTALEVSYIGEQWRAGGADILNTLNFSYGFGGSLDDATTAFDALTFTTPFLGGGEIALDGNDPQYQTAIAATIEGLAWAPGQMMVLRWAGVDLPGQDNGLAIDNLTLVGIPAPGAVTLLAVAGLLGARRRRG
jgi:hypothetical protein